MLLKRRRKLGLGRIIEKFEALSFNFVGKQRARDKSEEGGVAISMATKPLAR
jgi:hypothetical protein